MYMWCTWGVSLFSFSNGLQHHKRMLYCTKMGKCKKNQFFFTKYMHFIPSPRDCKKRSFAAKNMDHKYASSKNESVKRSSRTTASRIYCLFLLQIIKISRTYLNWINSISSIFFFLSFCFFFFSKSEKSFLSVALCRILKRNIWMPNEIKLPN